MELSPVISKTIVAVGYNPFFYDFTHSIKAWTV